MDDSVLKKMMVGSVPFAEEYEVQWKDSRTLDRERQLLDVEEYGITSSCTIHEKLFILDDQEKVEEIPVRPRKVLKKHYGEHVPVDVPGEPIGTQLKGEQKMVLVVHSSFITQPKGPHSLKRIIEAYR